MNELPLFEISGTFYQCGIQYGEQMAPMIRGFYSLMLAKKERRLTYAQRCWKKIVATGSSQASFIRGVAKGSGVEIERLVLLLLHEEVTHQFHCSAFSFNSRGHKTYVGQTWDWPTSTYCWPGLLLMAPQTGRRTLTYHYPGLWTACGINECGLSLMWTGSGFFPKIRPVVGIPTYLIIAELLQQRDVKGAVNYLRRVKNAGSFIFLLGDANGARAVIEGMPGEMAIKTGGLICRSNYFVLPKAIKRSRQWKINTLDSKTHMVARFNFLENLIKSNQQHLGLVMSQDILTNHPQINEMEINEMTIDSLIAIPQDRTLFVARGGVKPNDWKKYAL